MEAQDKKREQILEAALKRFAHFGLSKTTMNEIANDLNFSKALLYYNFPDKINLYASVLGKLFTETDLEINKHTEKMTNSLESMCAYIDLRQSFIERYYTLLEPANFTAFEQHPDLVRLFANARQMEKSYLVKTLERDIKKGLLKPVDVENTAELLFEALLGIRFVSIDQLKTKFGVDKAVFKEVSDKQKQLITIFLAGLK